MKKVSTVFTFMKKIWRKCTKWFKNASTKKKAAAVIIVLIISILIGRNILKGRESDFVFTKVTLSTIIESVSETGNVETLGKTDIFSPTNGIVENLSVKNGDAVALGQQLFTVRSTATEQEKAASSANYLAAKAALNSAEAALFTYRSSMYTAWDTFRNLATNDTYEKSDDTPNVEKREAAEFQIAQDNWLAAEKKYKDQETAVSQARSAVQSTYLLYQATQDAIVKTQDSGTIANLSVSVGDRVLAPIALNPDSLIPVLSIANFSTNVVRLALNESDISKIKIGQEAILDPDAIRDKTYKGRVIRVDDIGTNNGGVVTYNVYLEILDADNQLKSGMTMDVEITTDKLENVLSVPNSSIRPYQGGRAVQIYNKKTKEAEFIPVKIGIRGEEKTQILEGLSEGQEIIEGSKKAQSQKSGFLSL